MSIQTKPTLPSMVEQTSQRSSARRTFGRLGLSLLLLTCVLMVTLSASAGDASGELTPMIPDEAETALQFGDKKDLAVVIAIDSDGNHKIYRGKQAESDGKEVPFPIDATGISSMDNFTIFKTNPWYVYVNGHLICL